MKNLNIKPINKIKHDILLHNKLNGGDSEGVRCVQKKQGCSITSSIESLNVYPNIL